MRSKAAKIVLWSLLGCIAAVLIAMLVMVIIAMNGGTGTSYGGILGSPYGTVTGILGFLVVALIFAWLLTEPSFKKAVEVEETDTKPQYVKKAAHAVYFNEQEKKEEPVDKAPAGEEPVAEESVAEESVAEESVAEEPVEEEPVEEETAEEEPVEEEPVEDESAEEEADDEKEDDDDEDTDIPVDTSAIPASDGVETVLYRYRRSFMSRIIQSSDNTKGYYSEIKNKLLSYKKVHARTSWTFESFNFGRQKIAKMNVRGKTLVIYLALEPEALADTKYHIRDMSEKAKYASVPVMMRVKSPRAAKYALELIDMLAEKNAMAPNPKAVADDTDLSFRETDKLIEEGLVKVVYNKNIEPDDNVVMEQANIGEIINK